MAFDCLAEYLRAWKDVNTKCFLRWFTILNFPKLQTWDKLKHHLGASLMVQWLSLWASSAGGHSFDPWLGDNDPTCRAVWPETKKSIGHSLLYNLTKYCPLFGKIIFLTDISFVCVCVYTCILFQMDKYKEKTLTVFDWLVLFQFIPNLFIISSCKHLIHYVFI